MMPVRADTRRQRTGRGLTGLDSPFRGNKTGNGLRNFHENGLVRASAGQPGQNGHACAGARARNAYLKGFARHASFIDAAYRG
jgi:hypothetical protein